MSEVISKPYRPLVVFLFVFYSVTTCEKALG